jgi:hypothetical protein
VRVLADLHHFDLFHAFQRLFEYRLGWELYRPIGFEWAQENFWALNPDPELMECFLSTESGRCDSILSQYETLKGKEWAVFSMHLPRVGKIEGQDGVYTVEDRSKDITHQAITLQAFKDTKFDFIISSIPQHFDLFERLRQQYQPQAKHIYHMGPGSCDWDVPANAKNLMLHTAPPQSLQGINHIYFHQEFDLDIFCPPEVDKTTTEQTQIVRSYVHFSETEELWKALDLDWDFKFAADINGPISDIILKTKDIASMMHYSGFTLHFKPKGESYGHILHNTAAVGRPLIINAGDFKDKMAAPLLEDGVTCIDICKYTSSELRKKLEFYSQPEEYNKLCRNIHQRFTDVVDFNREGQNILMFLSSLK